MLICDKFVVLNMPKTGSTFVRTIIAEIDRKRDLNSDLDRPSFQELMMPNSYFPGQPLDQHGSYRQIPESHKAKVLVSVARNPYDKYASEYEFNFWVKHPPFPAESLSVHFPQFPNISFEDFLRMHYLSSEKIIPCGNPLGIGKQTIQFIRMYYKDPLAALKLLTPDYVDFSDRYKEDMANIVFLRQDHLNDDLADFLFRMGYTKEEADFCRSYRRVNVTHNHLGDRNKLWTPKTLDFVTRSERFLFRVLSNAGITFQKPKLV